MLEEEDKELTTSNMYYLYEIVGKKVGVTQDITRRQKEQKDKGILKILGEYTDIYEVSEKEREIQALKGYHVDKDPYWYTVTVQNKKSCTKEAIAKHKANNDFRKASIGSTRKFTAEQVISIRNRYKNNPEMSAGRLAREYNVSIYTMSNLIDGRKYSEIPGAVPIREKQTKQCPHCGKVISGAGLGNYHRWHGDNCKSRK
jgi:DNA-binding transcriptional regulator YiaG